MTKRTIAGALSLAVILVLSESSFAATSVVFNGVGSSAEFNAFALAAESGTAPVCGTNSWSQKSSSSQPIGGIDSRSSSIPEATGNVWIVWNNSQTTVCAYLSIDSIVGNQLFFARTATGGAAATLSINSAWVGTTGANLVPTMTDTTLPQAIYNAITGKAFNCAMSDIRPEDALFAVNRALAALNTSNYNGLGYGPGPIGTPVQDSFGAGKTATPVAFALSGTDPITGGHVPTWTTTNAGGLPLIVFVNTQQTGSSGDFSNTAAFQNVDRRDLAEAVNGTYPWTRDITSAAGIAQQPLNILLREPISGTYNTFEFCIPRNLEINSTQELGVNPAASGGNPLDIANPYSGGWRKRVIGTGQMTSEVGTSSNGNVLGYAFWGTGNFTSDVSTTRYLTVDGVDPLFANYEGGFFPTCVAPCPGLVSFSNVLNGSYPIWSIERVVTLRSIPSGVTAIINAAQSEAANVVPDFVPIAQMNVFRSHYKQSGFNPSNGYKAGSPESGGDMGGAAMAVQADQDAITDTGLEYVGFKQ